MGLAVPSTVFVVARPCAASCPRLVCRPSPDTAPPPHGPHPLRNRTVLALPSPTSAPHAMCAVHGCYAHAAMARGRMPAACGACVDGQQRSSGGYRELSAQGALHRVQGALRSGHTAPRTLTRASTASSGAADHTSESGHERQPPTPTPSPASQTMSGTSSMARRTASAAWRTIASPSSIASDTAGSASGASITPPSPSAS